MNNQVESAFSGENPAQADAATQTDATTQADAATQAGAATETDAAAQTGVAAQSGAVTQTDVAAQVARSFDRAWDQMRPVTLERNVMKNADGSCLVTFGDTRVLCTATVEEGVPAWRRSSRAGWVTAEYAMLPASTNRRTKRERTNRKGRSMEIERLIGRSLRSVVDLNRLGEYTITLDCDVLQADGGTRTASITGAWVALHDALYSLIEKDLLPRLPLTGQVAAISMGYVNGQPLLDLDYPEDSHADIDMNLVGTETGQIIEVQGTGEGGPFDREQLNQLLDLGQAGIAHLVDLQNQVTGFRE